MILSPPCRFPSSLIIIIFMQRSSPVGPFTDIFIQWSSYIGPFLGNFLFHITWEQYGQNKIDYTLYSFNFQLPSTHKCLYEGDGGSGWDCFHPRFIDQKDGRSSLSTLLFPGYCICSLLKCGFFFNYYVVFKILICGEWRSLPWCVEKNIILEYGL